jgi:hypothetical protein
LADRAEDNGVDGEDHCGGTRGLAVHLLPIRFEPCLRHFQQPSDEDRIDDTVLRGQWAPNLSALWKKFSLVGRGPNRGIDEQVAVRPSTPAVTCPIIGGARER